MKQSLIFTALLLLAAKPVHSQTKAPAALRLYAILGVRGVSTHHSLFTHKKFPFWATSLGAGSSWRKNAFQPGTEFHYSNARRKADDVVINYSGFNSSFFAAYQILRLNSWSFYSSFGICVSKNMLMFTEKGKAEWHTTPSSIYTQAAVLMLPAIVIEHVNAKGMLMGVSMGYGVSVIGKKAWEQEGSGYTTPYQDNPGGFYIQLETGSVLQLMSKI